MILLTIAVFVFGAVVLEASAAESTEVSDKLLDFLDAVPYPAVYIALLLFFFLSVEAGYQVGRRRGPG